MEELRSYLKEEDVDADFHEFSESTLTVEDSSELVDVDSERVVKSLVFRDTNGDFLVAVVPGDSRADEDKLSKVRGSQVRMAKAREVEEATGYKIGEVPPVFHGLDTYVDSSVVDFKRVFAGGGSTHALVELNPEDIVSLTNAELVDITNQSS